MYNTQGHGASTNYIIGRFLNQNYQGSYSFSFISPTLMDRYSGARLQIKGGFAEEISPVISSQKFVCNKPQVPYTEGNGSFHLLSFCLLMVILSHFTTSKSWS